MFNRSVLLNWPLGTFAMLGDALGCHDWSGGGAVGIQRVEAMGAVNFLQHIQDAPFHSYTHNKGRPGPDCRLCPVWENPLQVIKQTKFPPGPYCLMQIEHAVTDRCELWL